MIAAAVVASVTPAQSAVRTRVLKPSCALSNAVEARDAASDSVRVRGRDEQRVTIGTKAASKLLVQVR